MIVQQIILEHLHSLGYDVCIQHPGQHINYDEPVIDVKRKYAIIKPNLIRIWVEENNSLLIQCTNPDGCIASCIHPKPIRPMSLSAVRYSYRIDLNNPNAFQLLEEFIKLNT